VRRVVPAEADVEEVARAILRAARPRWRDAIDVNDQLLRWATRRPQFRTGLFRFVDAFPACTSARDVLDHLDEYLLTSDTPRLVRTGLRVADVLPGGAHAAEAVARMGIERMAQQFIGGRNEHEAVERVASLWSAGFAATVDLLGEKTLTLTDADAYTARVRAMLAALSAGATRLASRPSLEHDPWGALPRVNISVKASALAPLLAPATIDEGIAEALERLDPIVEHASAVGATIHLDTEHDELKDPTFALLRELGARRPNANLGCVVQAYRVDAERDLTELIAWSRATLEHPLQVRLVKGAYWDAEMIKAQAMGWRPPVWPEKDATDASYEQLTSILVAHAGAVRPAFASHNARSIAHALCAAEAAELPKGAIEIQLLHGMAQPLHDAVRARGVRTRVYVPIGDLVRGMAYLVRRLLENTANESFVRQRFTEHQDIDALVAPPSPHAPQVLATNGDRNGRRLTPKPGSEPFDNEPHAELRRVEVQERLVEAVRRVEGTLPFDVPLVIGGDRTTTDDSIVSVDPGRTDRVVCHSAAATIDDANAAVAVTRDTFPEWSATPWALRAEVLFATAELMRQRRDELTALEVLEAGKPLGEADADVCEAIDFCEYYGRAALRLGDGAPVMDKPGEDNRYWYEPRGVGVVIAPWNFPLAIPTGMVTAALVTGNTVVFKPAEQTPGVALRLAELLHEAGLPSGALAFLPGIGEQIGPALVEHPDVAFIAFTGSKAVGLDILRRASIVQPGQSCVKRVIAEMGGKNAVIVDADADLDEAVPAIVQGAFGYAGQKCSATSRVIACEPVADALEARLAGAVELVPVGQASDPSTVVGPLIDADALKRVRDYQTRAETEGRVLVQRPDELVDGWFAAPTLVALDSSDRSIARDEIFGPVLAVLRAPDFETAIAMANDTEYALTAGCFSRTPSHLERASRELRAGNVYLNRSTTGAMVGRQPFGGFGLSGVGSKAGGPDYLLQFVEPRSVSENTVRQGFAPSPSDV
jgi:RHH-type proline utilization regulon transcriptional repressor/proline dehydrogenase/delta 1-pyrroline-5-carboxylate dehydrogenase